MSKFSIAHHKRRSQVILRESIRARQQHTRTQMVCIGETESRSMRFLTVPVPEIRLQETKVQERSCRESVQQQRGGR